MARKLRVQYVGAVYHVMKRGDRREPIFKDEEDRGRFLGNARGGLMFPVSSALSAPSAAIVAFSSGKAAPSFQPQGNTLLRA